MNWAQFLNCTKNRTSRCLKPHNNIYIYYSTALHFTYPEPLKYVSVLHCGACTGLEVLFLVTFKNSAQCTSTYESYSVALLVLMHSWLLLYTLISITYMYIRWCEFLSRGVGIWGVCGKANDKDVSEE